MSLRDFAKHKPCMVRLIGVCNFNSETTILAHLRKANVAGVGGKPPDTCAVWACSACHDVIDGRRKYATPIPLSEMSRADLEDLVLRLSVDSDLLDALVRQHAWYDEHEILVPTV